MTPEATQYEVTSWWDERKNYVVVEVQAMPDTKRILKVLLEKVGGRNPRTDAPYTRDALAERATAIPGTSFGNAKIIRAWMEGHALYAEIELPTGAAFTR